MTSPTRKSEMAMTTGTRPAESDNARLTASRVSGSSRTRPGKGGAKIGLENEKKK